MAKKGRTRAAAAAAQAANTSILLVLDADALVGVLHAAKAAGILAILASSSRQLCSLARSRVPVRLQVHTQAQAQLVIRLQARGGPTFSSCSFLSIKSADLTSDLLAVSVLGTAKQWAALEHVELRVDLGAKASQPGDSLDCSASVVLSGLPALQQLRCLGLTIPDLGVCSVDHIGQLVQLTCLQLIVEHPAAEARPNLAPLAALTNLVELNLQGVPAVQPAAATPGLFCLPSSLTALTICYNKVPAKSAAPMACWVTHLPACPQLQHLTLSYGQGDQHASAHPHAVVALLAQHTQQLRALELAVPCSVQWGAHVAGLPDAAGPVDGEWQPDAALAALMGLQQLDGVHQLSIKTSEDWQWLAQLSALTRLSWACLKCAPPLQQDLGAVLALLEVQLCDVYLGGYDLGCLLLACPVLEVADVTIIPPVALPAGQPPQPRLSPHPSLEVMHISDCCSWGSAAAAVAHFAALAPVLERVVDLALNWWPIGSSSQARGGLPDLSPCTALTRLEFGFPAGHHKPLPPEQEDVLSMLSPLVRLRLLELRLLPRVNARVVLVLQSMLLQLRRVLLVSCGEHFMLLPAYAEDEKEDQAVAKVRQLLRPGLVLELETV